MVGEGLFTLGDGRGSSGYLETHRNITPSKTVRPNLNGLVVDDVRRMNIFDDPVTFVRELSTSSLGVPEFSKFEKNVYRSRYLNTPDCFSLLNTHYNNLMTRYMPKLMPLLSQYRTDLTLNSLNCLFTSDHMKSLTVLVVLGNHHNLNMDGLSSYLQNAMKLVYRAVTSTKSDPVEKSRMFYSFLTKWENTGRVVVLYMLLLSALEKLLWFSEGEVADDDMFPVFSFMICCFVEEMLNSEVVEYPPQKMGLIPPMSTKMDMLVRHFSVVSFLLKLKVTLSNAPLLLSCVRALRSKLRSTNRSRTLMVWTGVLSVYLDPDEVSSGSFKAPRTLFDDVGVNNNLLQFTHVVSCLEYCFKDHKFCKYVEDNLSITKFVSLFLFNSWKLVNNLKDDLANEILLLANTMLDTFPKTLASLSKFLAQFLYKGDGFRDKMDVLNGGTNVGYEIDSKLTVGVQKSLETLFNIALFGKSRLQMSSCLFLSKLLLNADVTRTLPRVNKLSYTNSMLTDLGLTSSTNNYTKNREYLVDGLNGEYNGPDMKLQDPMYDDEFVKDLSKFTLLASLMKYCWKDVVSCLLSKLGPFLFEYQKGQDRYNQDKYFKLDQLDDKFGGHGAYGDRFRVQGDKYEAHGDKYKTEMADRNGNKLNKEDKSFDKDFVNVLSYVKSVHLGSVTKESLYASLCTGNLPSKMLSYETLSGLTPTPDTLVMCAMMVMYGKYNNFVELFNKYLSMKSNYSSVTMYNRNWVNYMLMLMDNMVTHYVDGCDVTRQKLFSSLLSSNLSVTQFDKEKYSQMSKSVKQYKMELQRLKVEYDQLISELNTKKDEYEFSLSKLKSEMTSTSERHRTELQKMKEVVTKTNSKLQNLEQSLNTANSENMALKQENNRMLSERDNLKTELNTTKNKVTQTQREVERLSNLMRDYEAKSARLKKLQTENDRMTEEMAQYSSNLDNVYRMLICLTDKYKSNLEMLESQKEKYKNLTHQLSQQKSTLDKLESDLKDKENIVIELTNNRNLKESEIVRLKDELMRREESLVSANSKIKEFKLKVESLTNTVQSRTDMLNKLNHQYNEMERELTQRRQQLTAIESAFHSRPL